VFVSVCRLSESILCIALRRFVLVFHPVTIAE